MAASAETERRLYRLAAALLTFILLYAAILRVEALAVKYGPIEHPRWAAALTAAALRAGPYLSPRALGWLPEPRPYQGGDPINYVRFARQMQHFYQPHVREPVFLFVTRFYLGALGGQDVAVSFASASFSVLLVLATYLLGSVLISRWAGLGAALAMAIEREVIAWGVDGWRDDAFAALAILSCWTFVKLYRSASFGNALLAGLIAGAAVLTRITSLSFLVPGYLVLAFRASANSPARRLEQVGVSVLLMAAVIAPYLLACAIAYGDPLFAINYHTGFYLSRGGHPTAQPPSALAYVLASFSRLPIATFHTALAGLTTYPFLNKWTGFGPWIPGLGSALAWLAVPGLIWLLQTRERRFALLLAAASLLPYAFTWRIPGGAEWRFTLHAYPFYLIASAAAAELLARHARSLPNLIRTRLTRPNRRSVVLGIGAGVAGLAACAAVFVLPYVEAREELSAGEPAVISADRGSIFFSRGWSRAIALGDTWMRFPIRSRAALRVPIPRRQDHTLSLRIDPFEPAAGEPQLIGVFLNGERLATLMSRATPETPAGYVITVPGSRVRPGPNTLELVSAHQVPVSELRSRAAGLDSGAAVGFRFWSATITPK